MATAWGRSASPADGARKFHRHDIQLELPVVWRGERYRAVLRNLSSGGALVELKATVPVGSELQMIVAGAPRTATVRWAQDGYAGCSFASPLTRGEAAQLLLLARRGRDICRVPQTARLGTGPSGLAADDKEDKLPLRLRTAIIVAGALGLWIIVGAMVWLAWRLI